jgi:D-beta-D-heptose 7-phosphate kinase / D-beta-D-heptose 1-phosphate adenosyltransferase
MSSPEQLLRVVETLADSVRGGQPTALVVGDLMLDRYLWGACDRISPEAPVQVVDVRSDAVRLGGAGNVVANLRALGAAVRVASVIGAGDDARTLRDLMAEVGASDAGVVEDPSRRVTAKTRLMASHQQVVRYDSETRVPLGATTASQLVEAVRDQLDGADVVILSDYGKGVCTPEVIAAVIALARENGVPVLCDPKGTDYDRYRGATAITPNRREAAQATGIDLANEASLTRAGEELRARLDLDFCLITLSSEGMALFDAAGLRRISTSAREVFDVTGAGDTVIAALALGLVAGLGVAGACEVANLAAGVVVGKVGSATATVAELRDHASAVAAPRRITDKIVTLDEAVAVVRDRRTRGQRIVFTNGCFDILHSGHIKVLEDTAALGDVLIIGLNSDASVRRLKGASRPINGEADRAYVLSALAWVDLVVLFEDDTPETLIRRLEPDVLAKGGDYTVDTIVGADIVLAHGGEILTVPLVPGKSTTELIQRIKELDE